MASDLAKSPTKLWLAALAAFALGSLSATAHASCGDYVTVDGVRLHGMDRENSRSVLADKDASPVVLQQLPTVPVRRHTPCNGPQCSEWPRHSAPLSPATLQVERPQDPCQTQRTVTLPANDLLSAGVACLPAQLSLGCPLGIFRPPCCA